MTLQPGAGVQLKSLLEAWIGSGYEPAVLVEEPGTFSHRGGILDIWPVNTSQPLRLELFGDDIESIREFDPVTQRSANSIQSVLIPPAREVLTPIEPLKLNLANCRPEVRDEIERDLERIGQGEAIPALEFYAAALAQSTIFDYLNGLMVLDEPETIQQAFQSFIDEAGSLRTQMEQHGELPADFSKALPSSGELTTLFERLAWRLDLDWKDGDADWQDAFLPADAYGGRIRQVVEFARTGAANGDRIVLVTEQARRLAELSDTPVLEDLAEPPPPGSISLLKGSPGEGLLLPAARLTLLTDLEIFGWAKPRRMVRTRPVPRDNFLSDIVAGDFVVHIEHGIGRFAGLQGVTVDFREKEYAVVEYAENDRLFVPTDQLDRLSKYVGVSDAPPVLHRLGSGDWLRAKARAKAAAENVARDLLALYAAREAKPGHSFGFDAPWQAELEASFPYVETPDQLQAIDEVKQDMEKMRPMDRLLCGDVGYGKTEVALRAAFKAAMDGKQVAVLVPTTILAQQHFNTFKERLQSFPTQVEMLSRFCTPKEKSRVLEGLRSGSVDICIGTHRLVQKDVAFKDLGLVVIDEEQRFGVAHKERLKQLRKEVDVLTMTATPIPRTLYMSLAGVRDMSTMETPPEDRLPIRTIVAGYEDELVRGAILRELDRGGQVYYVHNRVRTIALAAKRLSELVPEARLVVGHGQMPEDQLEKVMLDFGAGRADVLVCSTIIESGLDIPNVNTIIVNNADHFGLAQLYQLRGRVGRGANRAYAYFLTARGKSLAETAEKRLRAIFEASELGSGFRIARRDLEIRGAGNLLGTEQSGHVAAVGLDLYGRLLADAVQELRGQPAAPRSPDVHIDLPLIANIPPDYVRDDRLRLNMYQRLAATSNQEDVDRLVQEIRDRFGPLPQATVNLALVLRFKLLAGKAGLRTVEHRDGKMVLEALKGGQWPQERLREVPGLEYGHTQLRMATSRGWLERLAHLLETLAS
jgi:transcription-repair coupling factor (superfamily II helicase)